MSKTVKPGIYWLLAFVMLGLVGGCSTKKPAEPETVAQVGNRQIDWMHLKRSFELNPKWGRGLTWREAYQNQLNFLIDEKLFAQAAESEGLVKDSVLASYLKFVEDKELIKELYRQEIADKIQISEEELQQAYQKSKKKVKLKYIFTADSSVAEKISGIWKTGGFEAIPEELKEKVRSGETPLFGFGDMEESLEAVVFDLRQGEIAGPVPVTDGFMVVQLIYGEVDKFLSEYDFAEKQSKLKKVIFERRTSKASNRFIKNFMADKDLQLNPAIFYALAAEFNRIIQNKTTDTPVPVYLNEEEIRQANLDLEELRDKVLISHRDGEMTVGEFLKRLRQMPLHLRPNLKQPEKLKDAIGVATRNEYLAKEARQRGLHKSPRAKREIAIQKDELLARYWVERHARSIGVTDEELKQYKGSPRLVELEKKLGKKVSDEELRDLLRNAKIAEFKVYASDSLKRVYPVKIDSTILSQKIKNPDKIISYNPAKVIVRELFN
ncbi:MAG: hypothetical protein Kow0037_21970 [Calditrichia bacterium]